MADNELMAGTGSDHHGRELKQQTHFCLAVTDMTYVSILLGQKITRIHALAHDTVNLWEHISCERIQNRTINKLSEMFDQTNK